ncbi:MAG: toll/interleukin-1 receptor domain-containing protein [Deltaproteobacteria bacterium]|nr:toll/interleukin-1 receptor domain-containing protein [Deltaproteobacteria bacterium]
MLTQPYIFVSYSHRDKRFADELMVHLAPLRMRFAFDLWSDQKITPGDSWKSEIDTALGRANIAILLVSADYLASDWIAGTELPRLLKRAEGGETRVIPIILRPCAWAHTPLAYFQAWPRDAKPFTELTEVQRDRAWAELTEVLEAELHRLTTVEEVSAQPPVKLLRPTKSAKSTPRTPVKAQKRTESVTGALADNQRPKFFISHAKEDGDFAENLKGRLRELDLDGWIDIDVLEAGVDWRKEIDEAILESSALILVLSPDSKASEYVTYEWAFALGSGLRIVPLMLRDTSIHPRLEVFQYLDFTNRRARPWSRLFALLQDVSEAAPNKVMRSRCQI